VKDSWIKRGMDSRITDSKDSWILGFLDSWIPGFLDSWIPGFLKYARRIDRYLSKHKPVLKNCGRVVEW
jgi:hypothetical protein